VTKTSPCWNGEVFDEDLAVLERRHRAGVDVDVRVELDAGDAQATRFEQTADA
jgi:hypothetical protein